MEELALSYKTIHGHLELWYFAGIISGRGQRSGSTIAPSPACSMEGTPQGGFHPGQLPLRVQERLITSSRDSRPLLRVWPPVIIGTHRPCECWSLVKLTSELSDLAFNPLTFYFFRHVSLPHPSSGSQLCPSRMEVGFPCPMCQALRLVLPRSEGVFQVGVSIHTSSPQHIPTPFP